MSLVIRGSLERPSGFRLSLDLQLPGNGVTAIIGDSGSGKSTLLRIVAGLEAPSSFTVSLNGDEWNSEDSGAPVPAHKRPINFVTQDSNLFPHLTIEKNLRLVRSANPDWSFTDAVEQFEIGALLQQMPDELSGGQKQRACLARAALQQAKLWMFDEPLSALDPQARGRLAPLIFRVCGGLKQPVLYVTHSLQEVLAIADHLVVLEQGAVIASGSPSEVGQQIDHPISEHIDVGCIVNCQYVAYDEAHGLSELSIGNQSLWVRGDFSLQQTIQLQIPARDISVSLSAEDKSSVLNKLTTKLTDIGPVQNGTVLLSLTCDQQMLYARITTMSISRLNLNVGQTLFAQIKSVALNVG